MQDFGVILVNKPAGITSFDVIRKLRKITGIKKIGHTGTLDPFATGLLPICIGKATRIAEKLSSSTKEYLVTMQFGMKTETGDTEGKIVEQQKISAFPKEKIEEIIPEILELEEQIPPNYSAVRVNGKRAYELARKNKEIILQPRPVKIIEFEIIKYDHPELTYRTVVTKGTYIRVLSETIAEILGTIGTTIELQRSRINHLDLNMAINLDNITKQNWQNKLIPLPEIFPDFPKKEIADVSIFKNGGFIEIEAEDCGEIMVLSEDGKCLGFARLEAGILKPKLVFI
ncbi:MAG: tRNA pseudouridine(55) synthase TruB [Candidatus Cloacimonadota bacterium]|nr:MAG: tRNA pseudouridine(55) synthase TruB [Candidatus Cloacimonadota bacterium]